MFASAVPPLAAVKCISQPHGQRDGFPPFEPEQSHLLVNQKGDSFMRHTNCQLALSHVRIGSGSGLRSFSTQVFKLTLTVVTSSCAVS